jgi:hypothetical protein
MEAAAGDIALLIPHFKNYKNKMTRLRLAYIQMGIPVLVKTFDWKNHR